MIETFLHHRLQCLHRVGSLEIVVGSNEYSAVFMCGAPYPLGHLLRCLNLNIDITRSGLYRPDQPLLSNLHRLDLAGLRGKFLQGSLVTHHLRYAAGRHKRNIRGEHILCLTRREHAAVQTDLRHLTLLQSLKYLLCRLVLYSRTNHIPVVLSSVTQFCHFMSH